MDNRTMTTRSRNKTCGSRFGVALLLILVVLVILSGTVYSLCSRIATNKHRQQYIIDYQKARYACDSGLKYSFTLIPKINLTLPKRTEDFPDLMDFSDTFWMDREQYVQLLTDWLEAKALLEEERAAEEGRELPQPAFDSDGFGRLGELGGLGGLFGGQDANAIESSDYTYGPELDEVKIEGPYKYEWPNVIEPIEFEIADAKITIKVEDENAKFPLIWATQGNGKKMSKMSEIALETFCSWMQMEDEQIDNLKDQSLKIAKYKSFQHTYKPITVTETVKPKPTSTSRSRTKRTSSRRRTPSRPTKRTVKKQRKPEKHAADFAKLIHGSAINLAELAMQIPEIEDRVESPMKYIGLWGATKVNVNTAPRHVLEATFTFGGQAEEIANEIIRLRREEPFKDMEDMKSRMYGFNDSLKKIGPYITMKSEYLTIKVTASYGKAKTTSIVAVLKTKGTFKTIASFSY
jgi:hypothetical protein